MKTHYAVEHPLVVGKSFAACNLWIKHPLTAVPRHVTCERCKKTKDYLEMMEGDS